MKAFSPGSRHHWLWLAGCGCVALLLSTLTQAGPTCPNWVETASGSVFNVAALIADAGSAEFALARVKRALSKVEAGGGCAIFRDRPACDETMALAKKAIVALEACTTTSIDPEHSVQR